MFVNGSQGIGLTNPIPEGRIHINMNNADRAIYVTRNNEKRFVVTGNGAVFATEVTVTLTDFPDYVFSKDYNLKSLDEVSHFIKHNGHLPGIPSAKEIESNGGKLGEIVKLQMEKIEELTLYIIELKKEIENIKHEKSN